jgi:hypothetical protein
VQAVKVVVIAGGLPLARYPFDDWRKKRGPSGEHVVELTVPYEVPDIVKFVRRVELRRGDDPPVVVFPDSPSQ